MGGIKKRAQAVDYSKVDVVKIQRGMSRGLNNRLDISITRCLIGSEAGADFLGRGSAGQR